MIKRLAMIVALFSFLRNRGEGDCQGFDPNTIAPVCLKCYQPYLKNGTSATWGRLKAVTKTFGDVVYLMKMYS